MKGGNSVIYITGDIHGEKDRIEEISAFCKENKTTRDDILILLGDTGINYWLDSRDDEVKEMLSEIPVTFVCIRGNHEARPENVGVYKEVPMFGGLVYREDRYLSIIFLRDGGEYTIENKTFLAIGGAYSVDKDYRLAFGEKWFPDEQLSDEEQRNILEAVRGRSYDYVITHTCPFEFQPTELFLRSIDQSTVDKRSEIFLGEVEHTLSSYGKWIFAHYHSSINYGRYEILYRKIKLLG